MKDTGPVREFDKFAECYTEALSDPLRDSFAQDPAHFHQRKLDLLRVVVERRGLRPSEMTWIDVGCGLGELLRLGKPYFARVMGCDVSSQMLAGSTGIPLLHQCDPCRLPFDDASADLMSAVCLFHHVEEKDRSSLMSEMFRVLKPGGLLAVIEHNPFNPLTQWIVKRSPVDENAALLTPRTSRKLLQISGLHFEGIDYFLYLPERLHRTFGGFEALFRRLPLGGQYLALGAKRPQTK
jgi:ubiquinone/menaquinone biosynthesis C-methylase UbiE